MQGLSNTACVYTGSKFLHHVKPPHANVARQYRILYMPCVTTILLDKILIATKCWKAFDSIVKACFSESWGEQARMVSF